MITPDEEKKAKSKEELERILKEVDHALGMFEKGKQVTSNDQT